LGDCLGLEAQLGELKDEVARVWHVLPDSVPASERWDAARASDSPWATLLLACSWQSHRELVRDRFIEANKNVVDLDDEG
jgi:hypothetical protein